MIRVLFIIALIFSVSWPWMTSIAASAPPYSVVRMGIFNGKANALAACHAFVPPPGNSNQTNCKELFPPSNWSNYASDVPNFVVITAFYNIATDVFFTNSAAFSFGWASTPEGAIGYYWIFASGCSGEDVEHPTTHECIPPSNECSALGTPAYYIEPSPPLLGYSPPHLVCSDGCQYAYASSAFSTEDDSIMDVYNPTQSSCNLEEEERELTLTGELDPPQSAPCSVLPNVIMCYPPSQDPTCFLNELGAQGSQIACPSDLSESSDKRCGFVNDAYVCVDTSARSCGTVNGEFVCFAKTGTGLFSTGPIPRNSPDHPLNGGNANGNPTDDVFDSEADVIARSLSDDDVRRELQRQGIVRQYGQTIGASNNYSSSGGVEGFDDSGIIGAINSLGDRFETLLTSVIGNPGAVEAVDYIAALSDAHSGIDEAIGSVGSASPYSFTADTSVFSSVIGSLIPAPGSCGEIPLEIHPKLSFSVDLCQLNSVRTVLGWIFYVATVITLFGLVTANRGSN